jgi:hypothetical protein
VSRALVATSRPIPAKTDHSNELPHKPRDRHSYIRSSGTRCDPLLALRITPLEMGQLVKVLVGFRHRLRGRKRPPAVGASRPSLSTSARVILRIPNQAVFVVQIVLASHGLPARGPVVAA